MRPVIALFIMTLGFRFFAFMQLVKMFTGIGPMAFVCLVSLALGILYGIIGCFGGGIGGLIARLICS